MHTYRALIGMVIAMVGSAAGSGCSAPKPPPQGLSTLETWEGAKSDSVTRLALYVHAHDSQAVQTIQAVLPAVTELAPYASLTVDYLAVETAPLTFSSPGGDDEIAAAILQLCAIELADRPDRWMQVVGCMNKDPNAVPGRWHACAEQAALLPDAIERCAQSETGKRLLRDSARRALDAGAHKSPTLLVDGKPHPVPASQPGFAAIICDGISTTPPAACEGLPAKVAHAAPPPPTTKTLIKVYIMSKCPYAVQALESLLPLAQTLDEHIQLELDYIATIQEGTITALHGPEEVEGNILQLCAMKHYPDQKQWAQFLWCWNRSYRDIPQGWEGCARSAGMNPEVIRSCAGWGEGKALLKASLKRAKEAGASGSPTFFIAGERYEGGRAELDFKRAVCERAPGQKPAFCADLPEPVEVKAIFLTDRRCEGCKHQSLVDNLKKRYFPKLTVTVLDYSEPGARKLFEELDLERLPVLLFLTGVEKAARYSQVERWIVDRGGYKQLKIPAHFDPTAEICDNTIDDTGNGRIDCRDPTCKETLTCRREKPGHLQVFIMSRCPFAAKALLALKKVKGAFGRSLTLDLHYIAEKTDDGFKSLHGQPEVEEDIRQLCAKKHYARKDKYLEYIWCRMNDPRSENWRACAKDGIRAQVIERCATGPAGKKLLERDLQLAKTLQITGSPTWLANNKHTFTGVDAAAIQDAFCKHNPKLAGCKKDLSDPNDSGGGGGTAPKQGGGE